MFAAVLTMPLTAMDVIMGRGMGLVGICVLVPLLCARDFAECIPRCAQAGSPDSAASPLSSPGCAFAFLNADEYA